MGQINDVVEGARYQDHVFGEECTVVSVLNDRNDVLVKLRYEDSDRTIYQDIETFKSTTGLELLDINPNES